MDSHLPNDSHTGNVYGMPVAHLLGYGDERLSSINRMAPKVRVKNLVIVGARSYEPGEKEFLEKLQVIHPLKSSH